MLYEFALEPGLLHNWRDFRFYVGHFGFDRGRLISRFPKRWKRMVYDSLGECRDIERARIEESLRRIDDRMVPRSDSSYDSKVSWLENAETEHVRSPFRAIIATNNDRRHPSVIAGDLLDDTLDYGAIPADDSRRLWKAGHSRKINRVSTDMADVVDTLIRHSTRVLFVDKYFGPENLRHRIPLMEILSRMNGRSDIALEVHCSAKMDLHIFKDQCQRHLAKAIPAGLNLKCFRWSNDDLHNRFILTDKGGVAFLEGLDQYMGSGRNEDVVVLLDVDVAGDLIRGFQRCEARYTLVDECDVNSTQ